MDLVKSRRHKKSLKSVILERIEFSKMNRAPQYLPYLGAAGVQMEGQDSHRGMRRKMPLASRYIGFYRRVKKEQSLKSTGGWFSNCSKKELTTPTSKIIKLIIYCMLLHAGYILSIISLNLQNSLCVWHHDDPLERRGNWHRDVK